MFDEKDPFNVQSLMASIFIITFGSSILIIANGFQQSLYFSIIGIAYGIVGFGLMLASTKNKITIPKEDFQKDKDIEIDFISKQKLWRLGLVLIILGLIFQLSSILFPENPSFN